ncbi:SGNH hydrolase [Rhizoclosmatium globosum]|uniref:SGNH hydrolase n=1 Tax=Rhizoclosmatium globosum TaxID=329046 RepID=A0A1Y2C4V4_9FUNG|nr:SGNH hydrolase [Rhizoclosmatium globosum]|eukprot:ORY42041.1 SGNH hydrolase [Rhizoclosmatium globosum]
MSNPLQILLLGDSLTEGYDNYGTSFHPYAIRLESLLTESQVPHKVTVSGVSGDLADPSVGSFKRRLETNLSSTKFDVVVILGGTNDLGYQQPPPKVVTSLRTLWTLALGSGAVVVAMTVPEWVQNGKAFGRVEELNQLIRQDCLSTPKIERLELLDLHNEFPQLKLEEEERERLWGDSVHPTAAGYDVIGEKVFEKLVQLGIVRK